MMNAYDNRGLNFLDFLIFFFFFLHFIKCQIPKLMFSKVGGLNFLLFCYYNNYINLQQNQTPKGRHLPMTNWGTCISRIYLTY